MLVLHEIRDTVLGGIVEPDQLMLRMPKLMDGETGCCRVLNLVAGKLKNLIGTFAAAEPGLVYLFVSRQAADF